MSFKKNLETSDVSLTSFQVHKKFSFTEVDSGSGVFSVPIIKGSDSNLFDFKSIMPNPVVLIPGSIPNTLNKSSIKWIIQFLSLKKVYLHRHCFLN